MLYEGLGVPSPWPVIQYCAAWGVAADSGCFEEVASDGWQASRGHDGSVKLSVVKKN